MARPAIEVSNLKLELGAITEAIQVSGGVVTVAAAMLKVHRNTLYRWIKEIPEVAEAYAEVNEAELDDSEATLIAIKRGYLGKHFDEATKKWVPTPVDPRLQWSAVRYHLGTKGRARGYGAHLQVETSQKPSDFYDFDLLTDLEREQLMFLLDKCKQAPPDQLQS